jgi:glycosyltransferase involved in cell wall biosynthesis
VNIVHIEDEPWDSGIADYALALAKEQRRRGHDVRVFGRAGSPFLVEAKSAGLPIRGWRSTAAAFLSAGAISRELRALRAEVVVAHTGSAHSLAALTAPRTAALVRTRADARPPKRNALTRWVASRTARFIAANAEIERQLRRTFPHARVDLVPQGLAGPERPANLPTAPTLGLLARLDPVKGHETALLAAGLLRSRVPGLRLICAGAGRLESALKARVVALSLGSEAEFVGRVENKWDFMAACRLGIVASLGSEAVSRACLEWMAAGRPVIASRVGGLPELVDDGVTGLLIAPGDPSALAEAAYSLLADPARLAAMGAAGRERWEKFYSLSPFYENSLRAYEKALHDISR